MFYRKRGYVILDCNATSVDLQAIIFALEFSSVLCITVSGTERVPLDNAYCQVLRTTSLIGRFDVPVIKQGRGAHRAGHQIAKICEQFPHKVTIICLGPLTNIADAINCSNTFHKKVKRILFAAGGFSGRQFTCHHNIEVSLCRKCNCKPISLSSNFSVDNSSVTFSLIQRRVVQYLDHLFLSS